LDPSLIIDPANGQHLISLEIQLQPEKEHLDILIAETKRLLEYVQELDPTAKFVSRGFDKDNKPFPDLTSSNDKHWSQKYATAQNWYQISSGFLFSQPPISERSLQARLEIDATGTEEMTWSTSGESQKRDRNRRKTRVQQPCMPR
jgi:hypothetical protein